MITTYAQAVEVQRQRYAAGKFGLAKAVRRFLVANGLPIPRPIRVNEVRT